MIYDEDGAPSDWVFLAVSPAFTRLTGFADVVGKRAAALVPNARETAPHIFESCARVASGGGEEVLEMEIPFLAKWMCVALSSPAPDHFVAIFADITERKATEAARQLSQLSLDQSADMIHWMTSDGRIIYASDSSVRHIGRKREELLTLTVFDLDPSLTPEGWAAHWRELRAAGSLNFETVHVTKDGRVFPVEITANYLKHGDMECNFAYTRDISDRRELETSLRLTQLSVDQAADMIHWMDSEGRILYASESTCTRHGYTREELLGMTIFDLAPVLTHTTWCRHWEKLRSQGSGPTGHSVRHETVHVTREGEIFPVEVVANYVRQGEEEYNFSFVRDITARKKAEQELCRAKSALECQNHELERVGHRLRAANEELMRVRDELALQACTDPLTGCLNRGAILTRLNEEIVRADREKTPLTVGLIDIDHFKRINDTFGHLAGDKVLREVVARSRETLRPYDLFGRFGGEEFLLVIPGLRIGPARSILERVRRAIAARPIRLDDAEVTVTASIGGAQRETEPADDLVRLADIALYKAKDAGRNRVESSPLPSAAVL